MSEGRYLSAEEILAIDDIKTESIYIPEWESAVRVRGLSGAQRDEFEMTLTQGKGKSREINMRNFRAKLVARSVVDEHGNRLFSEDQLLALSQKSSGALQRIVEVANRLSGLSDEDVEELTKNSASGPNDDSISV